MASDVRRQAKKNSTCSRKRRRSQDQIDHATQQPTSHSGRRNLNKTQPCPRCYESYMCKAGAEWIGCKNSKNSSQSGKLDITRRVPTNGVRSPLEFRQQAGEDQFDRRTGTSQKLHRFQRSAAKIISSADFFNCRHLVSVISPQTILLHEGTHHVRCSMNHGQHTTHHSVAMLAQVLLWPHRTI